jgi:hypothetical protein
MYVTLWYAICDAINSLYNTKKTYWEIQIKY